MFLLTFLLTHKYVKLHFMRIEVFEISQSFKKIVEFLTNVNFPHFVICCCCCCCFVRRKKLGMLFSFNLDMLYFSIGSG